MKQILSHGSTVFLWRIAGGGANIAVVSILLAMATGDVVGMFILLVSAMGFATLIGSFGIGHYVTRRVSHLIAEGEDAKAAVCAVSAIKVVVLCAAIIAAAAAPIVGIVAENAFVFSHVAIIYFIIILNALLMILSCIARGIKRFGISSAFDESGPMRSVIVAGFAYSAWHFSGMVTFEILLYSILITAVLSNLISLVKLWSFIGGGRPNPFSAELFGKDILFSVALPMLLTAVMEYLLRQSEIWLVGTFGAADDVAAYKPVLLLAELPIYLKIVVTTVIAAHVGHYLANNDKDGLSKVCAKVSALAGLAVLLFLAGLTLFGGDILAYSFGEAYRDQTTVLMIRAIAAAASIIGGPAAAILLTCGHQVATGRLHFAYLGLTLVTMVIGWYAAGVLGVCIASSLTMIALPAHLLLFLWNKERIWTSLRLPERLRWKLNGNLPELH